MAARASAVGCHDGGGAGSGSRGQRSHAGRVACRRSAAGLLGAVPADHRRPGGLGDAAGPVARYAPVGPARQPRLAPECVHAAGRVRRRQLGPAHCGAASAQPGPRRGPGGAERTAARGPAHPRRGTARRALRLSRGGSAGRRGPARGCPGGKPPALAYRGYARKGAAGGTPGQCRGDQLPRRLRPARPVAARDRADRGPVSRAGSGRRGLRDCIVRRVRPAPTETCRH